MTPTQPLKTTAIHLKKNSGALRVWHWGNTLILSGSLITVLINSTILKGRSNTTYVIDRLQQSGAVVTKVQAESVAYGLEDRLWDVHIYFGYFLIAFLLFRIILEMFQPKGQRLISKLKMLYKEYSNSKINKSLAGNSLPVKALYLVFYLLLLVMCSTGICLVWYESLGITEQVRHSIKEIHGFCMYPILAFILVHLAGVFLAERKGSPGIVSDMINGGKESKND
jgi:Ni/Fe-hydrogenase 1 B-type cytochrome subunit